ncbi:hypothetical protein predicted by Glimmer/Critica [Streptococcus dysgalactiae subsp. equisimilis AC-2713]|uniref:Uncharacterized protein n=1 Tax=Streptococcus dysgalactiae subsp. equisimilis AC-2713 TaxID=759913 RepID=A0AB33R5Z5_STREQ|nr:hypothetical protein predicted by Glimmer/Critica [Streptococcus dysgalactiae subsp. equisimilis AC-2713]
MKALSRKLAYHLNFRIPRRTETGVIKRKKASF